MLWPKKIPRNLITKKIPVARKFLSPAPITFPSLRNTNMAAVSLFWDTNNAAVTSCEDRRCIGTIFRTCEYCGTFLFEVLQYFLFWGPYIEES